MATKSAGRHKGELVAEGSRYSVYAEANGDAIRIKVYGKSWPRLGKISIDLDLTNAEASCNDEVLGRVAAAVGRDDAIGIAREPSSQESAARLSRVLSALEAEMERRDKKSGDEMMSMRPDEVVMKYTGSLVRSLSGWVQERETLKAVISDINRAANALRR